MTEALPTYADLANILATSGSNQQIQGFFDDAGYYGELEWARYFNNLFESGVNIKANQTMDFGMTRSGQVITLAADSFGLVRSYFRYYADAQVITVPTDTHIGRIVLRHTKSAKQVNLAYIRSTSGSAPALTRNEEIWEISLYRITVSGGAITAVVDERINKSVCGAIRPKNLTEYYTWLEGINEDWQKYFAGVQGQIGRQIFIQPDEPQDYLEGAIWIKTSAV